MEYAHVSADCEKRRLGFDAETSGPKRTADRQPQKWMVGSLPARHPISRLLADAKVKIGEGVNKDDDLSNRRPGR